MGDGTPLGRLLKDRREALRMSRTTVARKAGVTSRAIESWENGQTTDPQVVGVVAVADALKITPDDLAEAVRATRATIYRRLQLRTAGEGQPADAAAATGLVLESGEQPHPASGRRVRRRRPPR